MTPTSRPVGDSAVTLAGFTRYLAVSPASTPPTIWATQYAAASTGSILPRTSTARVTAGLKWAPEMWPAA